MHQYGYCGNILRVDLSTSQSSVFPTLEYAERFIGGRGIATKIYWDEVTPNVSALDPDNRLIIATGPLGGVPGASGSQWQVFAKSPATDPEQMNRCCMGGHWGAHLKFAGYDGIVVQGKSDKPVYLFVEDGKVTIRDATPYWGRSAVEVREAMKKELGYGTMVLATGPAGDNMVRYATILAENDASGAGGLGAVMGSKHLKAIAVKGTGKVNIARPEQLQELRDYIRKLNSDKEIVPATWFAKISGVKERRYACYGCISGCPQTLVETSDGKRSKRFCHAGSFYQENVRQYYGEYNDVIIKATRLCNEYGLDTWAVDALIGWLSACHASGVINDQRIGIPISKIGSLEFIESLVRKVALREGFGSALADGLTEAAQSIGHEAEKLVPGYSSGQTETASGQESTILAFDPRSYILSAIVYAMEPRPAMWQLNEIGALIPHWVGWTMQSLPPEDFKVGQMHPLAPPLLIDDIQEVKAAIDRCYVSSEVIRNVARQFWGSELAADFTTYEGKALAAKKIQDRSYAKECLVLCMIMWPNLHSRHTEDHVGDSTVESKLLSAVTGNDIDQAGLEKVGERVFNLTRAVACRDGRKGRESDNLPDFCFTLPIGFEWYNPEVKVPGKNGEITSRQGAKLARDKFEKMMDEYYHLRSWDVPSGLQTTTKLEEVGLADIVNDLRQRGLVF